MWNRLPQIERELGLRFEIIIQHDAEDVVHPKSMRVFNAMIPEHDFVQLPVLPLPPRGVLIAHVTSLPISASDLRRRVRAGRSLDYRVPPAVIEYVRRHRLYGATPA